MRPPDCHKTWYYWQQASPYRNHNDTDTVRPRGEADTWPHMTKVWWADNNVHAVLRSWPLLAALGTCPSFLLTLWQLQQGVTSWHQRHLVTCVMSLSHALFPCRIYHSLVIFIIAIFTCIIALLRGSLYLSPEEKLFNRRLAPTPIKSILPSLSAHSLM